MRYFFFRNWDFVYSITKYDTRWSVSLGLAFVLTLYFSNIGLYFGFFDLNNKYSLYILLILCFSLLGLGYGVFFNKKKLSDFMDRRKKEGRYEALLGKIFIGLFWFFGFASAFMIWD